MLANSTSDPLMWGLGVLHYTDINAPLPSTDTAGSSFVKVEGNLIEIDASQAWFWTEEWQAGEREVDEYIAAGDYEEYNSLDDMFRALDE